MSQAETTHDTVPESEAAVWSSPEQPDRPSLAVDPDAAQDAAGTSEATQVRRREEAALGVIRLGVGAALVAAPRWAGRLWVGPGADGPGSLVFARALGARDVALGLRILQGWKRGEPVGHWIAAGFAADGADAVATLIASRHLTPGRRLAVPAVAAAVGLAGFIADRRARG